MPINGEFSFRKCVWSMEKKKLSLPKQIGIALLLGILAGYAFYMLGIPEFTTNYLKPFGTIFVNLLKFIVVPVVLLSMIDGIISMGDMKKVGSVGWKTVAYFLVTTAAACVIGLVFANLFNNAGWFPTLALEDGAVWDKATSANFMDTLVAIFPSNMWKSFTDANMLQVIVIALMFGGGILAAGGQVSNVGILHEPQRQDRAGETIRKDDIAGQQHLFAAVLAAACHPVCQHAANDVGGKGQHKVTRHKKEQAHDKTHDADAAKLLQLGGQQHIHAAGDQRRHCRQQNVANTRQQRTAEGGNSHQHKIDGGEHTNKNQIRDGQFFGIQVHRVPPFIVSCF